MKEEINKYERRREEKKFQKYEQIWKHLSSRRGRYMKEEINKYERRREEKAQGK